MARGRGDIRYGVRCGVRRPALRRAAALDLPGLRLFDDFRPRTRDYPGGRGGPGALRQAFYAHLALLHISLALRISGDLLDWIPGRQWGGMLNVFALLLFMLNTGLAIAYARRKAAAANPSGRRQRTDTALSEPSVSSTKS